MSKQTQTIKFDSDSNFSHFVDAAQWRHAENYMDVRPHRLEIEFMGDIDPVLVGQGKDFGGVWT